MAWDTTSTMTLLAYGADIGLTSLTGDSEKDSLSLMTDLENVQFPLVKTNSGETWTLAWGPVVLSKLDPVQLKYNIVNTMYAAQLSGTNTYVIGIAGTDFHSFYDWAIEDLDVAPVTWPYSTNGTISHGASTGLTNLQGMIPFTGTPEAGSSLIGWLGTLTTQPITIYVAGHSLGGALVGVVAQWLADTQGGSSGWDPNTNATILPYSFAGPTPGDATWAAHFTNTFPKGQRVWNNLDVVPHAWQVTLMQEIETLYGGLAEPNLIEKGAINAAIEKAMKHDYTQALGNGTPVQGTFQGNLMTFASQAYYQHICAYYAFIGVMPPSSAGCPTT